MDSIKDRNCVDLTEAGLPFCSPEQKQRILRKGGINTQKNCTKKTQIINGVITHTHLDQTSWNVKSSGP